MTYILLQEAMQLLGGGNLSVEMTENFYEIITIERTCFLLLIFTIPYLDFIKLLYETYTFHGRVAQHKWLSRPGF